MDTIDPVTGWDEIARERAATVLERAFIAAQLGMPSEDHETAVDTLRVFLAALLADHLAPDDRTMEDREGRRVAIGEHWQRLVTTAVTHTFLLGGGFVQPDELLGAVDARATGAGRTRRPLGHGALVLRVHEDITVLDASARAGRPAGPTDMAALIDLIANATIGAALDGPGATASGTERSAPRRAPWARSSTVAATFGIPEATLVEVTRDGWVCDACGCFFAGTVEGTIAYPDRFAPIGRDGACDLTIDCVCHAAPVQREVR